MILLIDTALETASVGLAREGVLIAHRENPRQTDHAAWLHPAIQELIEETGMHFSDLKAVAVTGGPGSYTGLRVGMAAAKGICYAQTIPLISISTLQLLAAGVSEEANEIIIALIDARREEVFAGIYNKELQALQPDQALILEPDSFRSWIDKHQITLTGNGAQKLTKHLNCKNLSLASSKNGLLNLASIAWKKWLAQDFVDLSYHEPEYLKEFHNTAKDR